VRRLAHLGGWNDVGECHGRVVITPNETAAATLGAPPMSLEGIARELLNEEWIAHPVTVQRLLREAMGEALGSADPEGVSRTLLPPIRELFRAGADLGADPGSARTGRLFEAARHYRSRLRAQGLVDPAEVLWEAAAVPPRRPVLLWGYPQLSPACWEACENKRPSSRKCWRAPIVPGRSSGVRFWKAGAQRRCA
jgi:hypothetical protein